MALMKSWKWFLLLWVAGGVAVHAQATSQPALQPSKFSFRSGSKDGGTSVEWDGKTLQYNRSVIGSKTNCLITPTPAQAAAFWSAMDWVHLWNWKPRYYNINAKDSWHWELEAIHGTNKVKTFGINASPSDAPLTKTPKDALPNQTSEAFQLALENLLGFKLP